MPSVRVATGGQSLVLTGFTAVQGGASVNLYTDAAQSLQVTFPITVGADTTYYYNDAVTGQINLAVTELNGEQLGNYIVQAYPGMVAGVAPRATQAQIESAVADSGLEGLHGYAAWTFDPALAGTTFVLATAGTVYTARLVLPAAASITNVVTALQVAGGTLTASQCLAGLYGPTGTLIGVSASQDVAWASTGVKVAALTGGPFACPAGVYTAAFMFNGTTGPSLIAGSVQSVGGVNAGIGATASRFGTADTGRTTTLATPLGTVAASVRSIWAALS
jgi:hypothetical protein